MKVFLRYCIVFFGLVAGYLLFGILSNLLPNGPILRHAQETLVKEDLNVDYGFAFVHRPVFYTDNYTDALIINQACCGGRDGLMNNVLLVPRRAGEGIEQTPALKGLLNDDGPEVYINYPRYWHGSTFLMRFLLTIDDYVGLRIFFYLLSSLLMLWALVAVGRRLGMWVSALWLLSMVLVMAFMMQFSIQFLPVLMISVCAVLWVVYRVKDAKGMAMLMFVVGSLTAYFDLLTCPMVTWGVPMCVWLVKERREHAAHPLVGGLLQWGGISLLWAVGYGATWVGKWLLATLATPVNVMSDGLNEFGIRAGGGEDFTRWDALMQNAGQIHWPYFCITLLVLLVLVFLKFDRKGLKTALMLLLTAIVPCVWYMATANHSYLHFWFTFRSMMVVLLALLLSVACLTDWERLPRLLKNRGGTQ